MVAKLTTEQQTYEKNFDELLGAHEGRFVVIYGERIQAAFDSQFDAVTWGYKELGNVPFLVKQVVKVETPLSFVSNLFEA
jgi:hypothetical protein